MGLFDKFKKPKWENEDPEKRIEGIKELDDQEILLNIAKKDKIKNVRKEAVKKITNQTELYNIANNDKEDIIREEAFEHITDENLLMELANHSVKFDIAASRKLTDQLEEKNKEDSLIKIVQNKENIFYLREYAAEKITNQEVLLNIVKNDSDTKVRKNALNNITNQKLLIELLSDAEFDLEKETLEKITDKDVLIEIALNNQSKFYRQGAIPNITNQEVLVKIALTDSDYECREIAISTLTNINAFEKLNNVTSSLYDVENYGAIIIEKSGNIVTGKENIFNNLKRTDSSNMHVESPSDAVLISIDFTEESGDLSKYFYKKIITGHGLGDLEIKEDYLFKNLKFLIVQGINDKVTNIDGMFNGCPNLIEIKGLETWDVSGLSDKTYYNDIYNKYKN